MLFCFYIASNRFLFYTDITFIGLVVMAFLSICRIRVEFNDRDVYFQQTKRRTNNKKENEKIFS